MIKEFKVPSPGESITEVQLAKWLVADNSFVERNDDIAEIESDKATLMMVAEESGSVSFKINEGDIVPVGTVAFTIDLSVKGGKQKVEDEERVQLPEPETTLPIKEEVHSDEKNEPATHIQIKVTPVAAEMIAQNNLSVDDIVNGLRRLSSKEVSMVLNSAKVLAPQSDVVKEKSGLNLRAEEVHPMSMLRKKLSERLVKVKNETAMLTTFNEIDMSSVFELRTKMQSRFVEKHGIKLGFMALFTKAVAIASIQFPMVNSLIDGDSIRTPSYVDVGIAMQAPKGLMVPIVRNAESKTVAQIELEIKQLSEKARNKTIKIDELTGGTISITNGGVFGSLMSTPILNPPQSAILGMHNIVDRPVAVSGQVVIRPMMYVALSYDHRIVDGKDSVGFLVKVKELIEHPERMVAEGKDPQEILLQI